MFHVSKVSAALQRGLNSSGYERADPIRDSEDETKIWESGHRNHVDPICRPPSHIYVE